jgi:hypothetical protein
MSWLPTSPATHLTMQGVNSLIIPKGFLSAIFMNIDVTGGKPRPLTGRRKRRARHREWQARDRASRRPIPPEPEWHIGCTWCWRTVWHGQR